MPVDAQSTLNISDVLRVLRVVQEEKVEEGVVGPISFIYRLAQRAHGHTHYFRVTAMKRENEINSPINKSDRGTSIRLPYTVCSIKRSSEHPPNEGNRVETCVIRKNQVQYGSTPEGKGLY